MEPLRISFHLSTPMVEPAFPIHLDGLVAWAAVDEAKASAAHEPFRAQEDLPFDERLGVWCASAVQLVDRKDVFTDFATKRTDVLAIADQTQRGLVSTRTNKLNLSSGFFRQALYYHQRVHYDRAEAWCIGDPDRLRRLLDRVRYLGALRRLGYGRIREVGIEPDESASERWKERIIGEEIPGYVPISSPIRPPYWVKRNVISAWVHGNVV